MSGAAPDHAVRILLMDNQRLFAGVLYASLEQDPRFEIVAVAEDGDDALRLVDEADPDVVLLDAQMPKDEAISATRSISESDRAPRVLILTGAGDQIDAVEAHDAGAVAFLRRPRSATDLLETLELATALISATLPQDEPEDP